MKNRNFKIQAILIITTIFLLASCKEENIDKTAPLLSSEQLFIDKDNNIYDTIKLDYKLKKRYKFNIQDDGDLDIILKSENLSSEHSQIAINGNIKTELISRTKINNDNLDIVILFNDDNKNVLRTAHFTFELEDRINQKSPIYNLYISAFKKLPPVSKFTMNNIALISDYEYEIDASSSYDQDRKFGGKIVQYIYKIDNKITRISKSNKIKYSFPGEGTYQISLIVTDNDGLTALSQKNIVVKKAE